MEREERERDDNVRAREMKKKKKSWNFWNKMIKGQRKLDVHKYLCYVLENCINKWLSVINDAHNLFDIFLKRHVAWNLIQFE